MSQVSLPVRIALAASLAFAALWFVALRPKPVPDAVAPTPAGAQSAPGKAVANAQDAAAAQKAGVDRSEAAATAAGSEATAARSDVAAKKRSAQPGGQVDVAEAAGQDVSNAARAVLRDVSRGKVAILLFWDRRVSDDRAVHAAVEGVGRRRGRVAVHTASMTRLADYEPITRGVPVVTSPTVLIIDRARRARSVGGLTVTRELEDLVDKAIRVRP